MRTKRAGALIIKNKKLLLVTDKNAEFYWTPGGRLEQDESYEECLKRELDEELGVKPKSIEYYGDFKHEVVDGKYFIVAIDGKLKPSNEVTSYHWYSQDDFHANKIRVSPRIAEQVYPQLIRDDLV